MRRAVAGLVSAMGLLLPQAAAACSISDFNLYDRRGPSHADVLERSTFVDWVDIAPRPPYRCSTETTKLLECTGEVGPSKDPHVAVVRERLKGRSPARFVLYTRERTGWPEDGLKRELFADMRSADIGSRFRFALAQKEEAEGQHRSMRYWDEGALELTTISGGFTSCGPVQHASVDPRLPYLVFRDAAGGVIAHAPVVHDDDELLLRLRRHAGDPAAFARAEYPLVAFLRSAEEGAAGEVLSCGKQHGHGNASLRVKAGGTDDDISLVTDQDGSRNWTVVQNHFEARKQRCPIGGDVFVLRQKPVLVDSGLEVGWARAAIPDATEKDLKALNLPVVGQLQWNPWAYRVTTVREGRLDAAGFITGLTLRGASSLTVDEALHLIAQEPAGAPGTIRLTPYTSASPSSRPQALERWLPVDVRPVEALVALGFIAALGPGMGCARRRWRQRR